ncbi:hypothetical protein OIDMADRAFT_15964 [Oidiodendron maius Zn]|uniref:Uncharacterized protein n=1 Tax=Oidiodendron maius (strain Zn) TaxID=913774 RepID=A0A0C3HXL9_OIDMZ|nr:hypothetical protein OIDMADRAFT_15964 [Oidiodendron maius Zn]
MADHRSRKRAPISNTSIPQEKALVTYPLRMAENGFLLALKYLRALVVVIIGQRSSVL